MQTVSTRGEKDPIQTHTAVVPRLPDWPGVDLIRLFALIKSPMRPRPAGFYPRTTKATPCVRPSNGSARAEAAGAEVKAAQVD